MLSRHQYSIEMRKRTAREMTQETGGRHWKLWAEIVGGVF